MKTVTRVMFDVLSDSGEDMCRFCARRKECNAMVDAMTDEEFDAWYPDRDECYDGCMKTFGRMAAEEK